MERRSFLKLLGLATACTIIPEAILPEAIPVIPSQIKAIRLKISNAMVEDPPATRAFIEYYALELSDNDPEWERKTKIQMGYDGDDFKRDIQTVILRYDVAA